MAEPSRPATLTERTGAAAGRAFRRTVDAWTVLDLHQRLAVAAALAMPLSMFAPWFQVTGEAVPSGRIVSFSLTGYGSFTWVEGAIMLVCGGVLWMMFARGEHRAFHLPGGDGGVITLAGAWCLGLLVWRILFHKPHPLHGTETGIEWGVMVAIAAAALMLGAGLRLKAEHLTEPPIVYPDERDTHQLTLDGTQAKAVIPAPQREPETAENEVEPTVAQLAIPIDDQPRQRRRTRRKPRG